MKEKPPNYFEGILQLRNYTKELIHWVQKKIKKDKKARIAKIKKTKNGIDLYISDQHYLQNLGKKIKQSFNGILKTSKKLHTQERTTSKLLYRVTVLFKQIPYRKGDTIEHKGETYQITHINAQITAKNIRTGKKEKIKIEELT